MKGKEDSNLIYDCLQTIPQQIDGRTAIIEMRKGGCTQWRQMEWIGFWFEWKLQECLKRGPFCVPGLRYSSTTFDAFREVNWCFKTHASGTGVILNDQGAMQRSVSEHGVHGVVIAHVNAVFNDLDGTFKQWHDQYKGRKSAYTQRIEAEGVKSRRRKTAAQFTHFTLHLLTEGDLNSLSNFRQGRNSNQSTRPLKYLAKFGSEFDQTEVRRLVPQKA